MAEELSTTTLSTGYEILTNKNSNVKIDKSNVGSKATDTVSVIMTFYNAERFLQQAMASVLNQITNAEGVEPINIDFVLVNDKSTDNSGAVAANTINQFKEVQEATGVFATSVNYIEAGKNLGCGGARKLGIENAVGDYFMFLDADDYYINRDFVLRAHSIIKQEGVDIVEFGVRMNTEGQPPAISSVQQPVKIRNNNDHAEIAMFADNVIKFNVWSKIYKREIVKSRPYSTARTFEDVRTVPYWIKSAKEILVMNTVEINYRAAAGSIIRGNIIDTRIGTITAIAELFPDFKDNISVLKAMYSRAMVDITALCDGHSDENDGFEDMSMLNTTMLKYIYPNDWQKLTFNPDIPDFCKEQSEFIEKNAADYIKSQKRA